MKALITATRLKTARACARLDYLRYGLGYRSIREESAPRFGTLLHKGLEAWWNAKKQGLGADETCAAAMAAVQNAFDPFERVKAEVLLLGYHLRWFNEPLDVIAVETEFRGPLINPLTGRASATWDLGGKLDVLVRHRVDGLAYLVEHKSSAEDIAQGSEYWRRLRIDGQVSTYYEGARFLGHDVAGCIYDVIGKPTQRPSEVALADDDGVKIVHDANGNRVRTKDGKKWRETGDTAQGFVLQTRPETVEEYRERLCEAVGKNPDKFFQRGTVVRLENEMADAKLDAWQTAKLIRENELAKRHPKNPDACVRYGRTCEFFGVCTGDTSLDDSTQFVKLGSVHPELSGAALAEGSKEESATP